jgi:3-dehydroquinate dehydratase / shikimate dehydrogenase
LKRRFCFLAIDDWILVIGRLVTALLCETVTGRTMAELRAARDAVQEADMVELRLDGIADVDVAGALAGRRLPALVTCRPRWEGGVFDGSEDERRRILEQAIAAGAEYVDIEWAAGFETLVASAGNTRVVLSNHDFDGVPADLIDRCRAMRAVGAPFIKMAFRAHRLSDCLHVFSVTREGNAVGIAMGAPGVATRVLAARFGSVWTYAGNNVAPGQIAASRLLRTFRYRAIGADTEIYGVVGNPVLHSLSPAMHNAAFAAIAMDAVYVPFEAVDFGDFMKFADRIGVMGASVTIPFKVDALARAQKCDDTARAIGAANTLRREDDIWEATNTDADGFMAPLLELEAANRFKLSGTHASILGAGGSARAVVHGLQKHGVEVTIHARRPEQAGELAEAMGVAVGSWPPGPGTWDILVNCTSLGLRPSTAEESPLPGGPFGGALVYDLIYTHETRLMREARAAGCITIGGLPMLKAQAERQFEWWTGTEPPLGSMEEGVAGRDHL